MNLPGNIPKEKLQKIVLIGIGTLAVVVLTVQFYVAGQCRSFFDARTNREHLEAQIVEVQQRERTMADNQQVAQQLQGFVDAQQAAMARGDAFAWAVREISLLVEKHEVHVLSLRPGSGGSKQPADKEVTTYTAYLELTGDYDQLGNFVKDVENHFPTAEIQSLEITGGAVNSGTHQMNLDISFRVRPEPAPAKKGFS